MVALRSSLVHGRACRWPPQGVLAAVGVIWVVGGLEMWLILERCWADCDLDREGSGVIVARKTPDLSHSTDRVAL
jgi:hypothetical protein